MLNKEKIKKWSINKITPYLILCPIIVLVSIAFIIKILLDADYRIMLMPGYIGLLILGVVLLIMDRMILKRWSQKVIVILEIISIAIIFLFISYSEKKLILKIEEGIESFGVVYPIEKEKATRSKYEFPFNRKIIIDNRNMVILLSQEVKEKYELRIESNCEVSSYSGERDTIEEKVYMIELHTICDGELEERALMEQIHKLLKD